MKKIGIFLEAPPHFGGTFQYTQSMLDAVAALPRDRFTIVSAYATDLWQDHLASYQDMRKIAVPRGFWGRAFGLAWVLLRLPMGLWRSLSPSIFPMSRVMLREQCDLWIFPAQDARSYQVPVPALVTVLDLYHLYDGRRFPELADKRQLFYKKPNYANICRWAKALTVLSEIDKQQVMESYKLPAERIHVLPLTTPRYITEALVPKDFDSRYSLPHKYFFYPAQFWEHKNHKNVLRAMAALKDEHDDLKLVLVGSKKNAWDSVKEMIDELGLQDDVILPGYVPDADMPEFYRRARALIFASCCGPTNIPPLEALELGCPMALAEATSMPDRVGDAALVFHQDSVEQITTCMRQLWIDDDLCIELKKKGAIKAAAWGQKQFNQRLEDIVTGLLNAKE
ncbi:MAG TPA: glycosyltransferase family 1 protein [Pelovirga sp.]|nr:glycosyltransferase family 1 protein [Pelovirga sp.]